MNTRGTFRVSSTSERPVSLGKSTGQTHTELCSSRNSPQQTNSEGTRSKTHTLRRNFLLEACRHQGCARHMWSNLGRSTVREPGFENADGACGISWIFGGTCSTGRRSSSVTESARYPSFVVSFKSHLAASWCEARARSLREFASSNVVTP